jgi:hypothetical protein
MKLSPDELLQGNHLLWRGRDPSHDKLATLSTGHAALDAVLPGGGWPLGMISEIVAPNWGIGELSLLLPVMAELTGRKRWLTWLAPPYLPYPPALVQSGVDIAFCLLIDDFKLPQDALWAMEKLMRSRHSGLVLAWPRRLLPADLRRLQLAAESGQGLGLLFHSREPELSLAGLRLGLKPLPSGLEITVLKARGSWKRDTILLDL